ncbi:MAG: D-alanine--D-alanine ligase, partial [Clostridiales bacterium]|nr:D-alanine--D-alanine ligase [Clostridiales bacterium]
MAKKLSLGIFFGSRCCEHEVSIVSALQLACFVNPFKYDVTLVYIDRQGAWYVGSALWKLETYLNFDPRKSGLTQVFPDLTARSRALVSAKRDRLLAGETRRVEVRLDCVIPVMHGLHGEDGSLQGMLEMMDMPYTSTGVAGSAVGLDKIMMKQAFRGCGFPVLPDTAVSRREWQHDPENLMRHIEASLPYPVFVKPANLGSSIGVSRADNRKELSEALALGFSLDRRCLVEKGLDMPEEVNCAVMGYDGDITASVVEMPVRQGELLDFKTKYLSAAQGGGMASLSRLIPAPISQEETALVQRLSRDIFWALDCKGVVRVDFMIDRATRQIYVTEINTIPGSLAFYLWEK